MSNRIVQLSTIAGVIGCIGLILLFIGGLIDNLDVAKVGMDYEVFAGALMIGVLITMLVKNIRGTD